MLNGLGSILFLTISKKNQYIIFFGQRLASSFGKNWQVVSEHVFLFFLKV